MRQGKQLMTNNSPEPETLDDGPTKGSFSAFLNAVSELSKRIIDSKAQLKEKFLLVILFLTVIFGGLGTVVFLIAGQWNYLLATIGSVIGVLFILGFVAVIKTDFNEPSSPIEPAPPQIIEQKTPKVLWQRVIPHSDISEDNLRELRKELEAIRLKAFVRLQQLNYETINDHLRANVFIPYYSGDLAATTSHVYELRMIQRLSINMDDHPDRDVVFYPGQGLTGLVFLSEEPKAAIAIEAEDGSYDWEEKYRLTDEQKKQIHPDLRWIISFPLKLKHGETERTAAILNVDGLVSEQARHTLDDLIVNLIMPVAHFADRMKNLDTVCLAITVEE